MRYYLISTILFFCLAFSSQGQIRLSDQAEIHVLTCGPYQGELYSAFGHSAIRVHDPKTGLDWLYNYGVFDFDQPNFYLNFARGYLNYKLAVMDYSRFRDYYIYHNRYIHEQVLNLNKEQKQEFFNFLQWNSEPENQYYYYDYFYDNCATRVRDALIKTFDGNVEFDGSYIDTDYTIRDLTDIYLKHQPWGDLGIDICLGLPMDKKATPFMYMFLPDYIESAFNHATIKTDSGNVPLVKNTIITYSQRDEEIPSSILTPLNAFGVLFVIILFITIYGWKKNKAFKGIDMVFFIGIGLVGTLLFVLWVATDHKAAANNLNVLWALPTHLIVGIAMLRKNKPKWLTYYFLGYSVLGALMIIFWKVLPQEMHYSLIPIVLILVVRSLFNYKLLKGQNL